MKFRCWLGLLLAVACTAAGARAVFVNSRGYQPVEDWADANGLRLAARHGEVLVLTNRLARLVLERDSHQAQINGVNVALSFPVAVDRGQFAVSQMDLSRTIGPLLFPARPTGRPVFTIALDPGHGGRDTGNHVGWHFEKTYTLALADELRDQLLAAGFRVILTRTKDNYVELPVRPDLANRANADLFVSLHFNATATAKAEVSGPETYCITPVGAASSNAQGEGANYGATTANLSERKSLLLAYQVQRSLVKNLGAVDRGVRRARFAVLRDAAMPAILIESGYMTHPVEGRKIFDAGYRKQIAAAIVKGILNYQKLTAAPSLPAPAVATNKAANVRGASRSGTTSSNLP
jgi:N-acetylmuramoyl-L-alanine amidase